MTCQKTLTVKQPGVLIIHIVVAVLLGALGVSIMMKKCPHIVGLILIVVALALIGVQIYFFVHENQTKDSFHLCSGVGTEIPQNRDLVDRLYWEGKLTENSNFEAMRKEALKQYPNNKIY